MDFSGLDKFTSKSRDSKFNFLRCIYIVVIHTDIKLFLLEMTGTQSIWSGCGCMNFLLHRKCSLQLAQVLQWNIVITCYSSETNFSTVKLYLLKRKWHELSFLTKDKDKSFKGLTLVFAKSKLSGYEMANCSYTNHKSIGLSILR